MSYSGTKELKPCPFCGAPVELTYPDGKNTVRCVVECLGCGQEIEYHDSADAYSLWNNRNAGEALKALVEAVRTAWYGKNLD